MKTKKIMSIILALIITISLVACANTEQINAEGGNNKTITIAYRPYIDYLPFLVMKEKQILEKHMPKGYNIKWVEEKSTKKINAGILNKKIDVACMSITDFFMSFNGNIPIKAYSSISSVPTALITNRPDVNSISDLTLHDVIKIKSAASVNHVVFSMACKKEYKSQGKQGNYARYFDSTLEFESNAISLQNILNNDDEIQQAMVVSSPYLEKAINDGVASVVDLSFAYPNGNTTSVAVAHDELQKKYPKIYEAIIKATDESMEYINSSKDKREFIPYIKSDFLTDDELLLSLENEKLIYSKSLVGLSKFERFMINEGFLNERKHKFNEFVFDGVKRRE